MTDARTGIVVVVVLLGATAVAPTTGGSVPDEPVADRADETVRTGETELLADANSPREIAPANGLLAHASSPGEIAPADGPDAAARVGGAGTGDGSGTADESGAVSVSYAVETTYIPANVHLSVLVTVENHGNTTQEVNVTFYTDDQKGHTSSVTVQPGTRKLNVSVGFVTTGEHTFRVNDLEPTTITVAEGGAWVVDTTVETPEVDAGKPAEVTATVRNNGSETETVNVFLRVETPAYVRDPTVFVKSVTVDPGETKTVTFEPTFDVEGEYEAHAGTTGHEPFTVVNGSVEYDYTVNETTVAVGEWITVRTSLFNGMNETVERKFILYADDEAYDADIVQLHPAEEINVTFKVRFSTPGTHTVRLEDLEPTTITVTGPYVHVESVDLSKTTVAAGDPVDVTVTLENNGTETATRSVAVVLDGRTVAERNVTLDAGETRTVTVTVTPDEPGEYSLQVRTGQDRSRPVTLEVRPPETVSGTPTRTAEEPGDPTETTPGATATGDGTRTTETDQVPTGSEPVGLPGFGPVVALAALAVVGARRLIR